MKTVHRFEHGNQGVALRHQPGSYQPWVTHRCNSSEAIESGKYAPGFYWGHYYDEVEAAISDFLRRCKDICDGIPLSEPERARMRQAVSEYTGGTP